MHSLSASSFVIPAEAGIQDSWTPAFAGVTEENVRSYLRNPVLSTPFHKYGRVLPDSRPVQAAQRWQSVGARCAWIRERVSLRSSFVYFHVNGLPIAL
jgi:hypothetical protein